MRPRQLAFVAILAICPVGSAAVYGQTVAPVQSPARPLGLPVHGPVMQYASDARSQDFYVNYMPTFMQIIEDHLAESVVFEGVTGIKLDASKLFLRSQSDRPIRIYFLAEGAGYHNTVGFAWTPAGSPSRGTPTVLFPDASIRPNATSVSVRSSQDLSNVVLQFADGAHQKFEGLSGKSQTFQGTGPHQSKEIIGAWVKSGCNASPDGPGYGERIINRGTGYWVRGANSDSGCTPRVTATFEGARSAWEPLKPGDFVEIGAGERGFQLDFFLIADAVRGGTQWLWNDPSENSDGLQHVVAFLFPGTPYVLLGFEDIVGGGDLDYNDALFVVDIGAINADNLDQDDTSTLPN